MVTWADINWVSLNNKVRKIQFRIYKAKLSGNTKRLHWLQLLLVSSTAAKLLAVRLVTTLNKGRKTPGFDKQVVTTPSQKMNLVKNLTLNGKASPVRRVWIPKPGKVEKRPLGIPVIKDRAKQALAKLALEPEWEAVFEPNSYGFRPGRSAQDAIEEIFLCLRHNKPKFVFDADIRKCFDMINHDKLLRKLNTFPLMEKQIKAWLIAGVFDGFSQSSKEGSIKPRELGTPQGGVISPLLSNIALHGLETHLKEFVGKLPIKPNPQSNRGAKAKKKALGVIRYADDFVLIHENRVVLELCIKETKKWLLDDIGLELNNEKSVLRDSRNGFHFLGFQVITVRRPTVKTYKVRIQPSRDNQMKILEKVKNIIQKHRSVSSYQLISMLRPVILGWANYFKYCECSQVFGKVSHLIFQKLRAWVFRRDTRNGRKVIKEKYFPSNQVYSFDGSDHKDNWTLVGRQKRKKGQIQHNFLPQLIWVKSRKHVKILGNESPYSGSIYWVNRSVKYSPYSLRITTLLRKQKQLCPICKRKLTSVDSLSWEVDHITPRTKGGKDSYDNLQLVHNNCHKKKTRKDLSSS